MSRCHWYIWSTLLRYLNPTASTKKPMVTLVMPSQPPDFGSLPRYDGNRPRKKNGSARPIENISIPKTGHAMPPPETEPASSAPTKGPVQAKDARAKTSPIISVGKTPLPSVNLFNEVIAPEGTVISNAPSKLAANAKKTVAINRLTQTFDPSVCMPKGPRMAETPAPRPVNNATTPTAKIEAWMTDDFFSPDWVETKYDIVIGIIGKTQGVKIASSPMPKASAANWKSPWSAGEVGAGADAVSAASGSAGSNTPARTRCRSGIAISCIAT